MSKLTDTDTVTSAGSVKKLTIPQIRHCLLALAAQLEVEPNTTHPSRLEVAGVLRYLAEETRRAPRGSRKKDDGGDGSNIPAQKTPLKTYDEGSTGKPLGASPLVQQPTTPPSQARAVPPDMTARQTGQEDGFAGVSDHAARYPSGGPGHGDYMLGWAEGEAARRNITQREHGLAEEARPPASQARDAAE